MNLRIMKWFNENVMDLFRVNTEVMLLCTIRPSRALDLNHLPNVTRSALILKTAPRRSMW